jgi:hypothetical protein
MAAGETATGDKETAGKETKGGFFPTCPMVRHLPFAAVQTKVEWSWPWRPPIREDPEPATFQEDLKSRTEGECRKQFLLNIK